MKTIIIAVLFGLCVASFAQDVVEPPGYGVYYKSKDGWQRLDYARPLGASAGAFSGATLNYHGAEAALQITDRRPVFYFNRVPTARNALIIRFEKKKDQREVQVIRSHVLTANSGPDKKHLPDVTVQSVNDHLVSITPSEDLPSGEYLLSDSGGYGGYDFGIK